MQNQQSRSHEAVNYRDFLNAIIHQGIDNKFSDTQMQKILTISSLNTVRKIRKSLQSKKVLYQTKEKYPNNEKLYQVKNQSKFFGVFYQYSEAVASRVFGEISHWKKAWYFGKYGKLIHIKYYPRTMKKSEHEYPLKLYKKNICPVCQGKLYGFKNRFGTLDRKCIKCKFTFYVGSYISAYEKPIKNKKPAEFTPWNSYYSPSRQKIANKIVGKILRES
jgi:ribosomal protein L37AE/L43A